AESQFHPAVNTVQQFYHHPRFSSPFFLHEKFFNNISTISREQVTPIAYFSILFNLSKKREPIARLTFFYLISVI
ncbi:MAG: hypothetical protein J6C42_12415, partial [Clostridia bacterium]|nr:hypothetical protein [Clostridia bacterium]